MDKSVNENADNEGADDRAADLATSTHHRRAAQNRRSDGAQLEELAGPPDARALSWEAMMMPTSAAISPENM